MTHTVVYLNTKTGKDVWCDKVRQRQVVREKTKEQQRGKTVNAIKIHLLRLHVKEAIVRKMVSGLLSTINGMYCLR